jgi:hypothetical protein
MKYAVLFFSLFYLSICEGLTLHALLLSDDTPASGLREEVHIDIEKVHRLLTFVTKETKIDLDITILQGKEAKLLCIKKWIDDLSPSAEKILFLYFAGHGFRTPHSSGQWPHLVLPNRGETVSSNWILEQFKSKEVRLSILLSDCCNNIDERFLFKKTKGPQKEVPLPGLKKLFLETQGSIVASAASPGQYAFCTLKQGGIFTDTFIDSLYKTCRKESPSWKEVFLRTRATCTPLQTPIFSLTVLPSRKQKKESDGAKR